MESNKSLWINEESEVSILSEEFDDYYIPDDLSVMKSIDDSQLYYFGIIDILTNFKSNLVYLLFSAKKKLEYITKRVAYGPTISAVPPQDYAERFSSFMDKIFDDNKTKDPSKSPKPWKILFLKIFNCLYKFNRPNI